MRAEPSNTHTVKPWNTVLVEQFSLHEHLLVR